MSRTQRVHTLTHESATDISTLLTGNALNMLDDAAVADSIFGTASAIADLFDKTSKFTLAKRLTSYGLVSDCRLDGWSFPDAYWIAICLKYPRLNLYPLGEIAERAVKKAILALILGVSKRGPNRKSLDIDEEHLSQSLHRSLTDHGTQQLLSLFVSQYFFETALMYLRRRRTSLWFDTRFWYNFSKEGFFVPQSAEQKFRQTLMHQCEERADAFLPFLREAMQTKQIAQRNAIIRNGFEKALKIRMSLDQNKQIADRSLVNVIVGSIRLSEMRKPFRVSAKPIRLLLHTSEANVSFSFDKLETLLGHGIHSLVKDMLDIGVTVYVSDILTKRENSLRRQMRVLMAVRHADIWSNARTELERSVSFLGRDNFSMSFTKRKERVSRISGFSLSSDNQRVCLLSGGLDSIAGAVWALKKGLTPVFVSHYASPLLAATQRHLVTQLERAFNQQLRWAGFFARIRRKGRYHVPATPRSVMTQHLRSFMFLCFAAGAALEMGIDKIYIFENGPVALNPKFSEARINTRTCHPHFLASFMRLIKVAFGVELSIENPFSTLTKGEVVSILADPNVRKLVSNTISCVNWFRVPLIANQIGIGKSTARHDGVCLPCIRRRVALNHSRLWENDAEYLTDVFSRFPKIGREPVALIADVLRFSQTVRNLSDEELLFRAPDFSVYAGGAHTKELIATYKRQSEELVRCFRARSNDKFKRVFGSAL